MKKFFQNLFGIEPPPKDVQKRAEPAAVRPSPLPPFEPFKKGDVIGGEYLVHGTLGMGGFGVVLLTTDRETNQFCALKTFRDEFLADASTQEAFKKEALLWVNLEEHPFILVARWVVTFSGRLFVAMDYVAPDAEGRVNLADHLRSGKPIRTERAVEWAIQFCMGMEHANAHGIRCHRDIKPANILITGNGTLKIADFGLAAIAERRPELTERQRIIEELCKNAGMEVAFTSQKNPAGQNRAFIAQGQNGEFGFSIMQTEGKIMCGTPGYMAPEVYRGEAVDVRSDIYTFGLVLWQMAAGSASPPFIGTFHGDIEGFIRATYEQQMSGRVPTVNGPLVVCQPWNDGIWKKCSVLSAQCSVLRTDSQLFLH
jgi:serine/threonine protein kinase